MDITAGGLDGGVAQPTLDDIELSPVFMQVGGKTVAQGVNTVSLAHPGCPLGIVVDLLGRTHRHGPAFVPAEKEPLFRLNAAVIVTKHLKAVLGQDGIAVLAALALFHPDHHPGGLDVLGLEPDRLGGPQPRSVHRGQQGAVFDVARGVDDARNLFPAQKHGQLPDPGPGRDGELGISPAQIILVEFLQTTEQDITAGPGQLPVLNVVEQKVLDLPIAQCLGRLLMKGGQGLH